MRRKRSRPTRCTGEVCFWLEPRQGTRCDHFRKISVDGSRVVDIGLRIKPGQTISIHWNAPKPSRSEPLGVKLVYRDSSILVIDKPAGLLSTPTGASEQETAVTAARRLCKGGQPPVVVHRLDRDTSGLMVFARGTRSTRVLRGQFDAHEVRRCYRCVVQGVPPQNAGLISSMLLRDGGENRRGSRRGTFKIRPHDARNGPDAGRREVSDYSFYDGCSSRGSGCGRSGVGNRVVPIRSGSTWPRWGVRSLASGFMVAEATVHRARLCILVGWPWSIRLLALR